MLFSKTLLQKILITALCTGLAPRAIAGVQLIGFGSLNSATDLSGLTGNLESGLAANTLGGLGSGLAWAGGNTFLALPDRGPNATAYIGGGAVDNTTSYIPRFHTISMSLSANSAGAILPYSITPTLTATTLLSSSTVLNYGSTAGLAPGAPSANTAGRNYFTGRSDAFAGGLSTSPNNARLDPEGIRLSNDGRSIFISDEYGPYVRQFDRSTGQLIKTFALPSNLAVSNLSANGATEISGNTSGRVANKGMEGLAISADGKTLIGFMQSALIQDGGDGAQYNRIVTIDIATGLTKQYAYNNRVGSKNYNSSEILAVSATKFLVLERDGKGLGDGTPAAFKQLRLVDLASAFDVSDVSDLRTLASSQIADTTLFLDLKVALNAAGITDDRIPAKLEGATFGADIVLDGQVRHTLWIANDNDFVPGIAGGNQFYAFAFGDGDLPGFTQQGLAAVPSPASGLLVLLGGCLVVGLGRRRVG